MIRVTIETYPRGPGYAATTQEVVELDDRCAANGLVSYAVRAYPSRENALNLRCRVRPTATLLDAVLAAFRAIKQKESRSRP